CKRLKTVSSKATSGSYASTRRGIDSIRSLMTPCGRSCHSLCICAVNSPVSRDGCSCPPRHALLAKDLVTWQAMVGRHILEDIVGRVAQYVDEHYAVDKWHLGDLIAWVAQSALKYRPRICELSKCLEGPLKMIVCPKKLPHTVTPCEIAVCRSTINAGSDRWPVRLQTRAVVSTETESGFITEDDTSPVCHTKLPEVGKNPVDTAYDVGSVVSVLADVGSSSQLRSVVSLWFLLMALDVWKEQLPYRSDRGAADTSIRPTCFSEAYYTAPYQSPSAARTAAGYVLEAS
ncbi:hypothetical protein TNCV_4716101, partial [Trichonephila clavipes]